MPLKLISLILAGFFVCACSERGGSAPDTATPISILDQDPPGTTAVPFAPGIVSTDDLEVSGVFSPGMDEFYFGRQSEGEPIKQYVVRYGDGVWQPPKQIEGEVGFITSDGNRTFVGNIYRDRSEGRWSENKALGPMFEEYPIMRLTVSDMGTYAFDVREEIGTLRYSRLEDGVREDPLAFPDHINEGRWTAHPFIAPDESYLIWDSERDGGYGETDLYISFKEKDGSWGPAINMGPEVNSEFEDGGGTVSPDGKHFFFSRVYLSDKGFNESHANIYWVDAKIIESLRPEG